MPRLYTKTTWNKEPKPKKEKPRTVNEKNLRKKLKKQNEELAKEIVKRRDNYTCQRCGKKVSWSDCHASHVIPVSRDGRLAYDPMNMKVLCYHDHLNWRHKHPIEAGRWFTDTFPERWKYLESQYAEGVRWTIPIQWLEENLDRLKNFLSIFKSV